MATARIAQYRDIVLTQGSADAFVQATENTGITPSLKTAWQILGVEFMFSPSVSLESVSADFNIQWSLSRESLAASPGLDNADVLYADGIAGSLTTSGQILIPRCYRWQAPAGMAIVAPTIYAQLDSNATALTLAGTMRVYFEEIALSELEILRMLSQG